MGCPFLPSVFASFFLANSCVWGCRAVCATAAGLLPGAAAGGTKAVAKLKQAMQLTAIEINLICFKNQLQQGVLAGAQLRP
jgi:hypothetical protein